jgi:hypothetical protein
LTTLLWSILTRRMVSVLSPTSMAESKATGSPFGSLAVALLWSRRECKTTARAPSPTCTPPLFVFMSMTSPCPRTGQEVLRTARLRVIRLFLIVRAPDCKKMPPPSAKRPMARGWARLPRSRECSMEIVPRSL